MSRRKRSRLDTGGADGGSGRHHIVASDGEEEEQDELVELELDDFDDAEGYNDDAVAALLSSFRSGARGGQSAAAASSAADEFGDDDGPQGDMQARIEELAATVTEKRRAAQALSVEVRKQNKARRAKKRSGLMVGKVAPKPQDARAGEDETDPDGQAAKETRRDRKRKRAEQSRLLMQNLRFPSKEEALRAFQEALDVLEPAYKSGKVKGLIETNEALFRRMGLGHKIDDFGWSDLSPYRHRINCLHTWHKLVLAGSGKEDAYRLVGAAYQTHYNTVRRWVRGFHANGYKISRLLSGLHAKTASLVDDEDIRRKAREFIRLMLSRERREKAARKLAQLQQRERKLTGVLRAKAAAYAAKAATETQTTQATTQTQGATQMQTESGASEEYCVCRRHAGEEEEGVVAIQCDACDGWFHPACVGLNPTSREYRAIKRGEFYCPGCLQKAEEESAPDRIAEAAAHEALYGRNPAAKSETVQDVEAMDLYEAFSGRVFQRWINDVLLKDAIAAGAKPLSLRAAYDWLRKLGFSWLTVKKTVYVDGHERPDVVQ
jgi:hypothetical protein